MIEENDPRLTSFVLGELSHSEMSEIEAAVAASEDLQRVVAEIRQATAMLDQVFEQERPLQLNAGQKSRLQMALSDNMPRPARAVGASSRHRQPTLFQQRWMPWTVAAAAFALLVGGTLYRTGPERERSVADASRPTDSATQPETVAEIATRVGTEKTNLGQTGELAADADFDHPGTRSMKGGSLLPGQRDAANQPAGGGGGGFGGGAEPSSGAEFFAMDGLAGKGGVQMKSMEGPPLADDAQSTAPANRKSELTLRQQAAVPAEVDRLDAPDFPAASPALAVFPSPTLQQNGQTVGVPGEEAQKAFPAVAVPDGGTVLLGGIQRGAEQTLEYSFGAPSDRESVPDSRQRLVDSTRELIAAAGLATLDLQVEVRDQKVTQQLQLPLSRYRQEQRIRLIDGEDGTTRQEAIMVHVPVQVMVPRVESFNMLRPYVLLDEEQAQRIVGQLAYNLDPEAQRRLSFEQLIGVDGLVLDSAASPVPEMKLAQQEMMDKDQTERGRFSAIQKKGTSFDRAAISLARTLNRQVTLQSNLGMPVAPEAGLNPGEAAAPGAKAMVAEDRGGESRPAADSSNQAVVPEALARQADPAAGLGLVSIPMTPTSLDEVDFSGLIQQLKQVLELRNRELGREPGPSNR